MSTQNQPPPPAPAAKRLNLKNVSNRALILAFPQVIEGKETDGNGKVVAAQFIQMAVPDEVIEIPPDQYERIKTRFAERPGENLDKTRGKVDGKFLPLWKWTEEPKKTAADLVKEYEARAAEQEHRGYQVD